ncbi:double zinc ribbon domain-containing protein [Parafrigoribacterium humi]|uniref:double zinc ribbon domain-containing protein n=1 Tax=Parafrigoribacterium humi TaxID=3144664 RepID=UPI0032ED65FA
MICRYCTTELPAGAMFCGECGRAIAAEAAEKPTPATPARPIPRMSVPAVPPTFSHDPAMAETKIVDLVAHCEQCGAELGSDDIFCGECGYVTRSAGQHFSRPRDTAIVQGAQLERDAMAAAASLARAEEASAPEVSWGLGDSGDELEDIEATRIVAQRRTGARFVLQFSTGESFTVYGSGLVGRNPRPEPAEYFDHIVRVLDPSRSVSKTHLEFGQEAGAFWIKDRFSGNGSIIREPEGDPVRCQPDRRYRIVRGTRVDIGEQFFVVS